MLKEFVKAAKISDISDGTMTSVTVEGDAILIACVDGQYYAIHNKCSHQGGWLDQGDLLTDRCEVMCPLHDACFDLRTGEPTAGPAKKAVKVYTVRVSGGRYPVVRLAVSSRMDLSRAWQGQIRVGPLLL
jgi:nitrite reductase/ring-hydroxylating ferredoxin subunit